MFQELFKRRQQPNPRTFGTLKNHIFTQDFKDDGFDWGNLLGMGLDMVPNAINSKRERDIMNGGRIGSKDSRSSMPGGQTPSMVSNLDPMSSLGQLFASQLAQAAGVASTAGGLAAMSNPVTAGLAVATPILSSLLGGDTTKETEQIIPQHQNSMASNRIQRQTGPIGGLQPITRQNRWGR